MTLLIYPACIALILSLGYAAGAVPFARLASLGVGTFVGFVGAALLADFVKNIFEEFAWRGYLAPRLDSLGSGVGASSDGWAIPHGVLDADRRRYLPEENALRRCLSTSF